MNNILERETKDDDKVLQILHWGNFKAEMEKKKLDGGSRVMCLESCHLLLFFVILSFWEDSVD